MTQQPTENTTWLTQEAYDRLKSELEHLSTTVRNELSQKISEARDEGDLKENGGYHAAKEEQGKVEARIRQLEDMLRAAKVGEAATDSGVVQPGMKVEIRFAGDDETEVFVLGSRELLSTSETDLDVYSPQSPLGGAINGKRVGDTASYAAPNGKEVKVEIVDAQPFEV